jgi:AraC-like DNA-binding protein
MILLSISEDVLLLISGLGLIQAALLAILIYFHPRSDKTVNKFLALYIFSFTIILSGPFFLRVIQWQKVFFIGTIPLIVGPLMLFYIRSFKETITWRKAFPHLIMFLIYCGFLYWWAGRAMRLYPDSKEIPPAMLVGPVPMAIFLVRYGQMMVYYFLARRQLISYQRSINQLFSDTSRINLRWGWWLINGYAGIIISATILFFLMRIYPENFNLLFSITIAVGTPYIYITSFKGISQPTIWQLKTDENKEELEKEIVETESLDKSLIEKNKSPRNAVIDEKLEEIVKKINMAMEEEKIYQETELTLHQLSTHLQFPSHQVSQAINDGLNKTFYDLVNGYRVEEAKRLLLNPKNRSYTILSVGFEAGFNSKTTFNTVFKKFTGLTPTDFRDRQRVAAMA